MIHYWLTDTDGSQYINNPGTPEHASKSIDGGVTWDRPRNNNTMVQREERMAEIMLMAKRNREASDARRKRLADQQDKTLANHIGNMETPEAAAERHRERIKALLDLKKIVDRKTIGEHMTFVLGCALFACFMAAFALLTVVCIDAIIKIVGAW